MLTNIGQGWFPYNPPRPRLRAKRKARLSAFIEKDLSRSRAYLKQFSLGSQFTAMGRFKVA